MEGLGKLCLFPGWGFRRGSRRLRSMGRLEVDEFLNKVCEWYLFVAVWNLRLFLCISL